MGGIRGLLLMKPALEFQWHHVIPTDIATRPLWMTFADLSPLVVGLFVYHVLLCRYTNPMVMCALGWKLIMAYFGQFSHRTSHLPKSKVTGLSKKLQEWGITLTHEGHRVHHREGSEKFCLLGIMNPFVDGMRKVTTNTDVWALILAVLLLGDIAVFDMAVKSYFR